MVEIYGLFTWLQVATQPKSAQIRMACDSLRRQVCCKLSVCHKDFFNKIKID